MQSPIPQAIGSEALVGDLLSTPTRDRELWDEEVYALTYLMESGRAPANEKDVLLGIISDRMAMLRAELAAAPKMLNQLIHDRVHHQLRAHPDFRKGGLVVEQWIPALRVWLVCGRFAEDTEGMEIVHQLQAGDPRHKTAREAYEESKAQAATRKAQIEEESSRRVLDTIADMSGKQLDQFIDVERAIKTGETIHAHGADLATLESLHDKTKKAAASGDIEAQRVLKHGQRDNALCVNPGDNPTIR